MDLREKHHLDRAKGLSDGYAEGAVEIVVLGGRLQVFTYCALRVDPQLAPYSWYKKLVILGAREHGLPGEVVEELAAMAAVRDPDPARTAAGEALLSGG